MLLVIFAPTKRQYKRFASPALKKYEYGKEKSGC